MFLDDQIIDRILKLTSNNEEEIVKAITDCFHYCLDAVNKESTPKTKEDFLKAFNKVNSLWNNAVKQLEKRNIYILNKDGIEFFFKKEFPEVYDKFYFIKYPEKKQDLYRDKFIKI
jgi:hypothetical protein